MAIVKSPTWTVTVAACDTVPGEAWPVIVEEYVRAWADVKVHGVVVVTFAAKLTGGAGHVTVSPVFGVSTCENKTVPAKLFMLVRDTERVAEAPLLKSVLLTNETVKSPTWTVEATMRDRVPGEPLPVNEAR
jgi:hypothetical protein